MLLSETMTTLLVKPLDTAILRDAADCVFGLFMARPQTFESITHTFAHQSASTIIQESVQKLLKVMVEQHHKQKEKLVGGQFPVGWGSPGLERYPSLNQYRKLFHSFIIESRSIVLIK